MQVNRIQPNMSARNKSNVTFAGVPKVLSQASDKLSDTVELGLEKVAKSKGIEKFIKKLPTQENPAGSDRDVSSV